VFIPSEQVGGLSMAQESKREILKDKVVDLVKEFIKTEGGLTQKDLSILFGPGEVKATLDNLKVSST
jgi:hypothetical protein